jgi:hypothetical protein
MQPDAFEDVIAHVPRAQVIIAPINASNVSAGCLRSSLIAGLLFLSRGNQGNVESGGVTRLPGYY